VCQTLGWTVARFNRLSESERLDWLAYDDWKRQRKLEMLRSMRKMISDGKSVDGGAYMSVWLSLLEA
jgi:hypothetical protein